jgi:FkbM family methyltransferase
MGKLIKLELNGHKYYFTKTLTAPALIEEIFSDNYRILSSKLNFQPNDIILDLGANEGMFSILMAKTYPKVKVISIEPVTRTYKQLLENISLNKLHNITTYQCAVGNSSRKQEIVVSNEYSGGSSLEITYVDKDHYKEVVQVTPIADIFTMFKIDRCKLLKIDVEGLEHETLMDNDEILSKIDNLVGEIHINTKLHKQGYSTAKLYNYLKEKTNLIHYDSCYMAE